VFSNRIARFTNLNTRTEKHNDSDVVRADLNFKSTIMPDDLLVLAGVESSPATLELWRMLLYLPQDQQSGFARFREHSIASISFGEREFIEQNLTIDNTDMRLVFDDVKLRSFRLTLDYDDHSLLLGFQTQLDPLGHLGDLAGYFLNRAPVIHISGPTDEFLAFKQARALAQAKKEREQSNQGDLVDEAENPGSNVRAFPDAVDGRKGL